MILKDVSNYFTCKQAKTLHNKCTHTDNVKIVVISCTFLHNRHTVNLSDYGREFSNFCCVCTVMSNYYLITCAALRGDTHQDNTFLSFSFQAPKRERKKSRKKETDIVSWKLSYPKYFNFDS